MEPLDHRTDPSKLWRTIKAIDGKSPPKAENEAITFDDSQVSSPKQMANYFNRQFTTSKLLCPAAKVMEALMLTIVNTHLFPAFDQHGFRPGHSTTSALLQLTCDVVTGFNQKKPPHRTMCVAIDLTAAFDTVNYNILLSKIAR